jgi:dephospho-CoA kinase
MTTITQDEWPRLAFSGKAGAGKTTAAEFLEAGAGYQRTSIAGPLKDMAAKLWGTEARTDREKLQQLGVAVRNIERDTWVKLLLAKIDTAAEMHNGNRPVIDDLRFPNEWWELKKAGFVLVEVWAPKFRRVDRLKANGKFQNLGQLDDESETALDSPGFQPDYLLSNDSTIDSFYEQIRRVLLKERSRV